MGTTLAGLMADYIIICRGMFDKPEVFIAGTDMIKVAFTKVSRMRKLVIGCNQRIMKNLRIIGF
jgi:hypothetical protein